MSDKGIKVSDLKPDRKNANKGTQAGLGALDKSLRELGAGRSVLVDKHGVIIAGNKTVERAADIGIEDVIIVPTDGTRLVAVQRIDLDLETDEEARQLAYADNRIAEIDLDWDYEQIDFDMADGVDLEWLNFEFEQEPEPDPGAQIDRAEELRELWGVETGQLWRLGEHRLICGDCTDAEVVDRVMDGEKADMVCADPPYNIDMKYKEGTNDSKSVEDYKNWCGLWFELLEQVCDKVILIFPGLSHMGWWWLIKPPGVVCCWLKMNGQGYNPFGGTMKWDSILVWNHPNDGGIDLFDFPNEYNEKLKISGSHPVAKPINLITHLVDRFSDGLIVVDPFLGSGTTLIACERLGRKCRAVEISPAYCAVAIQRWVDMTSGEPELIDS